MQPVILIMDDNEDDALLTKLVLSKMKWGFKTEVALSGEAGLALIQGGNLRPNLILLDLKMPGMDGIEVLRTLRGDKRLSSIPVVIVTHSGLKSDEQACVNAGANSYLHKSTDINQFKKELECILICWLDTSTSQQ